MRVLWFFLLHLVARADVPDSIVLNSLERKKSELVDAINAVEKNTWKAAINPRFATATPADFKILLGTRVRGMAGYVEVKDLEVKTSFVTPISAIPASFDAREAWPQCAGIVGHVRDQSSCGSCWAMAATEAFNDRSCIAGGDTKTLRSPGDTLSCCKGITCNFSMGCDGGQPVGAWMWFKHTGVASGGDYIDRNSVRLSLTLLLYTIYLSLSSTSSPRFPDPLALLVSSRRRASRTRSRRARTTRRHRTGWWRARRCRCSRRRRAKVRTWVRPPGRRLTQVRLLTPTLPFFLPSFCPT